MDYVKQGVDQLGQAAEKVKEAVSSATSTVLGAVKGDQHTRKFGGISRFFMQLSDYLDEKVDQAKQHGKRMIVPWFQCKSMTSRKPSGTRLS
jgi:hypothetical protein